MRSGRSVRKGIVGRRRSLRKGIVGRRRGVPPGDIEDLVRFHGEVYWKEWRYDRRFEDYVARGVSDFARRFDPRRDRLWLVRERGRPVGCIAMAHRTWRVAQLRWYLVAPQERGRGLGKRLVRRALRFARSAGYRSVFLWTTSELDAARHVYEAFGFRRTARKTSDLWGRKGITQERYSLSLLRSS